MTVQVGIMASCSISVRLKTTGVAWGDRRAMGNLGGRLNEQRSSIDSTDMRLRLRLCTWGRCG